MSYHFIGGSFPGSGMPMGQHRQPVNNTELYETLNVPRNCSQDELRVKYKKLAFANHPDKGGDPETFKKIAHAYDILGDETKRKIYDAEGEEGLDAGGGGGGMGGGMDLFEMFFNQGGGRRGGPQRQKKGEDITAQIGCSLEQLYKGGVRKLLINKDVLCPDCNGRGGPADAFKECTDCSGKGQRVKMQNVGPMIVQPCRTTCSTCRGQGRNIASHLKCKKCSAGGTVKEKKQLEVYIPPGAPNKKKVTFSGEADHRPGETPGDVIFIVHEAPHPIFKRKGCDLSVSKEITLYEALCGYKFVLKHLDDRILICQTPPGEVIDSNSIRCITGEGMPLPKNISQKGNLYIHFTVKFPIPSQMDDAKRKGLKKCLPEPDPRLYPKVDEDSPDVEHCRLEPFDASKEAMNDSTMEDHREAYEEDEERPQGGGVQCEQQ